MASYARRLPIDQNNNTFPAPPPFTSYQSQSGNPSASSILTLTQNTTVLQVMSIGGNSGNAGIIGKWAGNAAVSVTGSNFDFMVNSGQVSTFVVPQSVMGNSASIQGANTQNGLYPLVALKWATAQASSVLTTEY